MRMKYRVPLTQIEYGVYGDLTIVYPKPDSICLRGTIQSIAKLLLGNLLTVLNYYKKTTL